ncbi:MAG: hypothetical protein ACRC2R_13640 [Xenococcaceae cyanobacterium]
MQIVQVVKDFLPHYPTVIIIAPIVLLTLLTLFLRYILNDYLQKLIVRIHWCLLKINTERQPIILDKLEQRILAKNNYRHINTTILIYNTYNRESLRFFCLKIRCELIDRYCQIIPNLLLVFGLVGTFLGIIINLNNFASAIEIIEINNFNKLIVELNRLFQATGISFIVSIISIGCSFLLTVFNLIWNTNSTKAELFNSLEDYIYNTYITELQTNDSIEETLETLTKNFEDFLNKYVDKIEDTLEKALEKIDKTSAIFNQTASLIEKSQFFEKISLVTTNLESAQNQFSLSSTQLQNSTQSLELKLDSLQQVAREILEIKSEINSLQQNYSTIFKTIQSQNNSKP